MFIRAKTVKGKKYAYLVRNVWTKKGPRQKVSKYLGKIIEIEAIDNLLFEEYLENEKLDQNKFENLSPTEIIKLVIGHELYCHGFRKKRGKWLKDDLSVEFSNFKVMSGKDNAVFNINSDFLCSYTLRKLMRFKSDKDEDGVGGDLAKAFVQAGIPIDKDVFVMLFEKIYRPGQSFVYGKVRDKLLNGALTSSSSNEKGEKIKKEAKFPVIVVTGTPGTGKTTVSKILSSKFGLFYIDVNKVIEEYQLSEGYDEKKDCQIIDTDKLIKSLENEINTLKSEKKGVIIDSHMSHYLPSTLVNLCIVTKCDLKILKKRLELRGYGKEKVRENLDSEIFEICLSEAKELNHNILEVSTDNNKNLVELLKKLIEFISELK